LDPESFIGPFAWIFLALGTAIFESLKNVFSKLALKKNDPLLIALATRSIPVLFLAPMIIGLQPGGFILKAEAIPILVITALLSSLNIYLFMRAIQIGELSTTEPMMNFTPLFLLATSPILIQEYPGIGGASGMFCIVMGALVLQALTPLQLWRGLRHSRQHWYRSGPALMLVVAALASLSTIFDKKGVQTIGVLSWAFYINLMLTGGYSLLIMIRKIQIRDLATQWPYLILAGFFNGLSNICMFLAFKLTLVAYVISVKRTSALFSVLLGSLIFNEIIGRNRLPGVLLMIIGTILISFFS